MRHAVVRGGLVAAMVIGSSMWAWPASAGGGCHRDRPTQGEGNTVAMSDACFDPNVLRVDPGAVVTFVNRDFSPHNVSATGWGYYEDMQEGDVYRAVFDEPGIYPFACTYHPAMTGAIVVGDEIGAGTGTVGAATTSSQDTATIAADDGSAVGWAIGGAGGFVLGATSALLLRRRRVTAE